MQIIRLKRNIEVFVIYEFCAVFVVLMLLILGFLLVLVLGEGYRFFLGLLCLVIQQLFRLWKKN